MDEVEELFLRYEQYYDAVCKIVSKRHPKQHPDKFSVEVGQMFLERTGELYAHVYFRKHNGDKLTGDTWETIPLEEVEKTINATTRC